jgi:hypothetical protein
LLVGGCSGGSDDAGSGGDREASTGDAPVPICDLLTADEVAALIGHPVTRGPEETGGYAVVELLRRAGRRASNA